MNYSQEKAPEGKDWRERFEKERKEFAIKKYNEGVNSFEATTVSWDFLESLISQLLIEAERKALNKILEEMDDINRKFPQDKGWKASYELIRARSLTSSEK
jgi:hypothetical protein